jgi:hypothetical protein
MVDISNFTTAKILDERPSPSGVEYRCELEPLWLAAELVEKAKMGRVHIRSYKNGLIQANRLGTLRERRGKERGSFHKCKHVKQATFNFRSRPHVGSPSI